MLMPIYHYVYKLNNKIYAFTLSSFVSYFLLLALFFFLEYPYCYLLEAFRKIFIILYKYFNTCLEILDS